MQKTTTYKGQTVPKPYSPGRCDHCERKLWRPEETGWRYAPVYWFGGQCSPGWLCIECQENAEETEGKNE